MTNSTAPSTDRATAPTLQDALAAAQAGRLQDACSVAERALASGGDPVALNALLGMLRTDLGDVQAAIAHLEIAHAARPRDVRIAVNLATALIQAEDLQRAMQVASRELALADPTLQLARIRGYTANQTDDFASAIEALEHVVTIQPDDWESWNNLGNARRGADDLEGCVAALEHSVRLNPLAAPSRLNFAKALYDLGRIDEAEAAFRQMASDFPDDPNPFRELYPILKEQGRDEDALDVVSAASERDPTNIDFLLAKASDSSGLHKMEVAEQAYRRVLEIDPVNSPAFLGLALVLEVNNRVDDLSALVTEAEQSGVADNSLSFLRAYDYRRKKDFEAGLAELAKVPDELETTRRLHLLAQLLDGAGRYDAAFETYSRMNELFRDDKSNPSERGANYRQLIRRSTESVNSDWLGSWRQLETDDRPSPVFLVGFPRSGTTLLDTILMSHPKVEVLEEEPTFRNVSKHIGDFTRLATMDAENVQRGRDAYFETAASLTPLVQGNLLIDKNPLSMNLLPVIQRFFPGAKIILALRHPCDVVLSCFMANFRLNDGMSNFISLDTTAELYDLSFKYYEHVQKLMPLPAHTVVYENVVADRENELRRLFDFLELDWHDAVLDHQKTARERGRVKTASYAQVVEPIYTRSAGRWVNYRKHLEPIIPVLEPWIRKFGYSTEG